MQWKFRRVDIFFCCARGNRRRRPDANCRQSGGGVVSSGIIVRARTPRGRIEEPLVVVVIFCCSPPKQFLRLPPVLSAAAGHNVIVGCCVALFAYGDQRRVPDDYPRPRLTRAATGGCVCESRSVVVHRKTGRQIVCILNWVGDTQKKGCVGAMT